MSIVTTTTTQVNTRKLLSELAHSKSSGCLWFDTQFVSWKIYLQQGNLKYVYCSAQLLEELKYYLHYLGFTKALAGFKQLPGENIKLKKFSLNKKYSDQNIYSELICWLLEQKYLNPFQSLQLIEHITKDALNSCLWSDRGTPSWHEGHFLPLWITDNIPSLNMLERLEVEEQRLKHWQNCTNQLLSIHQRPYFTSDWQQKPLPTSGVLKYKNLQELTQVIQGQISIRQLSLFLRKDELHVAQILSPYIDGGIVQLKKAQPPLDLLPAIPRLETNVPKPFSIAPSNNIKSNNEHDDLSTNTTRIWKIICIDDSPTILQEFKRFLATDRFEITSIDDPVQAVPIIFNLKPDLILLDINMPRINGYKLCKLLRGSDYCDNTPIIMVTGNTGLIDKAKAKLAGATDYLNKPFTQEGLAKIVSKHLR